MKKLLAILLGLVMLLSLTGCSEKDGALLDSLGFDIVQAVIAEAQASGIEFPEGEWELDSFEISDISFSRKIAKDPSDYEEGYRNIENLDLESKTKGGNFFLEVSELYYETFREGILYGVEVDVAELRFAPRAEDITGVWMLSDMESEGTVLTGEQLAEYGLEGYLILEENGGRFEIFGESLELDDWTLDGSTLYLVSEGETEKLLYADGMIQWSFNENSVVRFVPMAAAFDGYSGKWICIGMEEDDEFLDTEAMAALGEGFELYLNEDGSALIVNTSDSSTLECSWTENGEGILLEGDGESMPGVLLEDGSLRLHAEEDLYVLFAREAAELPDYSGSWICTKLEVDGEVMDAEALQAEGMNFSMELYPDGNGYLENVEGEQLICTWQAGEAGVYLDFEEIAARASLEEDGSLRLMLDEGAYASFSRKIHTDPSGDWGLAAMNMLGMTITAGDFAAFGIDMDISLYADGSGLLRSGEESGELLWSYDPETFTLLLHAEGEELKLIYDAQKDLLLLSELGDTEEEELSMIFARVDSAYYLDAAANSSLADLLGSLE